MLLGRSRLWLVREVLQLGASEQNRPQGLAWHSAVPQAMQSQHISKPKPQSSTAGRRVPTTAICVQSTGVARYRKAERSYEAFVSRNGIKRRSSYLGKRLTSERTKVIDKARTQFKATEALSGAPGKDLGGATVAAPGASAFVTACCKTECYFRF